ncbi:MAG: penicillin-binding protein 1A [Rhodocyclaceae bacterium]|nr:penicillin-binding protein 1A [Rhodocyclaceae bacterium]
MAIAGIVFVLAYPKLPAIDSLRDYRPRIPLRVYTADGALIGEFGEERRQFIPIQQVPEPMKQAILAAEDERFYQHAGIDIWGVARAIYANFIGGGKRQGASTITMQVARNFFLSSEKTLKRKLFEALLAYKIERELSKDEILELYINQIYLGQRAYGFAAAAQIYFGKPLEALDVAEMAMLAGLPKAPSSLNPIANPKRAKIRQEYVLRRMRELGFIDEETHAAAVARPLAIKRQLDQYAVRADHVAEMARQIAVETFPEGAYTSGLKVITTLLRAEQEAAWRAVRRAVLDYDRRHGYRGPEAFVDLTGIGDHHVERLEELLTDYDDDAELRLALVLEATPSRLRAYLPGGEIATLEAGALKFAQRYLDEKAPAGKRIRRGAIIRVMRDEKGAWQIAQWPEVEAAFVAADPQDGAVRALVGGFDFGRNQFNHVTQAWRQPGSSMKPFIYAAALEKGFTPLSVLADEPLYVSSEETGSQAWEPKNYDGKYEGPMTLRTALAKSKNMVSIRLLRAIGTKYAQDYITRFGFDAEKNPPYLTLALGAGSVTPWQQLAAYAVFANGGYLIEPYVVQKIVAADGRVLAEAKPALAGNEARRVIDARNAWLMDNLMQDVVRRGTAARAGQVLKRRDLAGKTGTTNDYVDAWFCGYSPHRTAIAWMGFDQPRKLGSGETGGVAALPMWIHYMSFALKDIPETERPMPDGIVRITGRDPTTQQIVSDYAYAEFASAPGETDLSQSAVLSPPSREGVKAQPAPRVVMPASAP